MSKEYIAHINENNDKIQTVKEHSENVAELCKAHAIEPLKDIAYSIGLFHDIGKYQKSFQERIRGANVRIEHSICGAKMVEEYYKDKKEILSKLLMEYCIAGHHSGIPDGGFINDTKDMSTLQGRLKRVTEDYSDYQKELKIPSINEEQILKFIVSDCGTNNTNLFIDKFVFFVKYLYSCLVDADSEDTAYFCQDGNVPANMITDFQTCLEKVDCKLENFESKTELQKARAYLQKQVFDKIKLDGEIFLMNMPTGSGKTLCSVKFALEKAILEKKKRIIYVIPYNSIIDQTVATFEEIFGRDAQILRHQSTFYYESKKDVKKENSTEDYRAILKHATENWSADFIITTMVQFFESIYSNRRGKLRKFHNMQDSIIIFDEAHLMPVKYLQPCLQGVTFITKYLNSIAVFLTATMPDFGSLIKQYALLNCKIVNLLEDISEFSKFQKCKYTYIGMLEEDNLLYKSQQYASSLIIVNKKKVAQKLYSKCVGKKYHLSTYLTFNDRQKILVEIRKELKQLEIDYPDLKNVPDERRITIISTSLIEAGVDLDMEVVFRQLAGLDSILQSGGRCNREGKRADAETFIFELEEDGKMKGDMDEKSNLTKGLLEKYSNISDLECIEEYYYRVYFMKRDEIEEYAMHKESSNINSIYFKSYSEKFKIIESQNISIVVPNDDKSQELVRQLQYIGSTNVRKLQQYMCSINKQEFEDLKNQYVINDFGTGIYCLMNLDYYDSDLGITFEAKDYII